MFVFRGNRYQQLVIITNGENLTATVQILHVHASLPWSMESLVEVFLVNKNPSTLGRKGCELHHSLLINIIF